MGILMKAISTLASSLGLTDPRIYSFLGPGESDSGERIDVGVSLQIDTVWACVRAIAETISTLPLHLYRTEGAQGVIFTDHPLYDLLHDQPNDEMSSVDFWTAVVAALLLWGNAFIRINRLGTRVVSLYPLMPDRITVRRRPDRSLVFEYTVDGRMEPIPEEEILHIRNFTIDGFMGLSTIAQARNTLGQARAAERTSSSLYRNGMRPSAVMKAPTYLTDPHRAKAREMIQNFQGVMNAGGVPLLEGGWEYTPIAIPPDDAEMLASKQFHVEQICRWFDTPPAVVGHAAAASVRDKGVEQVMILFQTLCIRKHAKRIETAVKRGLLTRLERAQGIYAEFNLDAMMRADSEAKARLYAVYAQNGLRTRNELRAMDNQAPQEGGDDLTVQANLVPLSKLGDLPRNPAGAADMPAGSADNSDVNASQAPVAN